MGRALARLRRLPSMDKRLHFAVLEERTVKRLCLRKALTLPESTTISEACRRRAARKVDALLLTNSNGLLCGILTDRDITTTVVVRELDTESTHVSAVITKNLSFVISDTLAVEALPKMVLENVIQDTDPPQEPSVKNNRNQGPRLSLKVQENCDENEEREHSFTTDDDRLDYATTSEENLKDPRSVDGRPSSQRPQPCKKSESILILSKASKRNFIVSIQARVDKQGSTSKRRQARVVKQETASKGRQARDGKQESSSKSRQARVDKKETGGKQETAIDEKAENTVKECTNWKDKKKDKEQEALLISEDTASHVGSLAVDLEEDVNSHRGQYTLMASKQMVGFYISLWINTSLFKRLFLENDSSGTNKEARPDCTLGVQPAKARARGWWSVSRVEKMEHINCT
ncbi:CBS domain-containing protein CBSCBSPB1 isoform X1 [Tanacetum coccineum]|uniref:CBS domain-containing protein CBSCBSPB1 isoform X1 n=1 Tax=Tanacetum coccineum TaxID=301880 RepID=A0ABQ5A259_9ASTR